MQIQLIFDDAAGLRSEYLQSESGPGLTSSSSRNQLNLSSRKTPTPRISAPSPLTYIRRSSHSDDEYDGERSSRRKNVEVRDSCYLFTEVAGIGKLLMNNKIICRKGREMPAKEISETKTVSISGAQTVFLQSGIKLSVNEKSLPTENEEEKQGDSADNLHALKRKQCIITALLNAKQDWRNERRRIVRGACDDLEFVHIRPCFKDRFPISDRNSG